MLWNTLETEAQLNQIVDLSFSKPQAIFKHSTRCSISSVAKSRLDRETVESVDFYYLDLISYRQISNLVAEKFSVNHESPQILLIKNGECVFDESHSSIVVDDLLDFLS